MPLYFIRIFKYEIEITDYIFLISKNKIGNMNFILDIY